MPKLNSTFAPLVIVGIAQIAGSALLGFIQAETFASWLFRQSIPVVLAILALIVVSRYFTKRDEKKDAELAREREKKDEQLSQERHKHEENLKDQIKKADTRMDKFEQALAQQTEVGKQSAEAIRLVNVNLGRLADEFKSERDRRRR